MPGKFKAVPVPTVAIPRSRLIVQHVANFLSMPDPSFHSIYRRTSPTTAATRYKLIPIFRGYNLPEKLKKVFSRGSSTYRCNLRIHLLSKILVADTREVELRDLEAGHGQSSLSEYPAEPGPAVTRERRPGAG